MDEIQFSKHVQFTLGDSVLEIIYLIASALFIMGLKMLRVIPILQKEVISGLLQEWY